MARAKLVPRTGRDEKRLLATQLWLLSSLTTNCNRQDPTPWIEAGQGTY